MKDFLGNELAVGDKVVFHDGKDFVKGIFTEFLEPLIIVVYEGFEDSKFPDELIKVLKVNQ